MKSRLIKFLSIVLLIAFLVAFTACTGAAPVESTDRDFAATYPSQFLTGDVYILKSNEKINGNIAGIGTTLIIEEDALVSGNINLIGGNLEVYGRIDGNINAFAGTTKLGDTAEVNGSLNQILNQNDISPKALIKGEINTYVFPRTAGNNVGKDVLYLLNWMNPVFWIGLQIIRIVLLVLVTLLATYLFPQPTFRVVAAIRKSPLVAWGVGILTQFALPIISLVLIITICLSPIGVVLILAMFVGMLWSWTVLSNIVGELVVRWLKLDWTKEGTAAMGATLIGMLIAVISLIPFAGILINGILCAIGIGGIITSRFGTVSS